MNWNYSTVKQIVLEIKQLIKDKDYKELEYRLASIVVGIYEDRIYSKRWLTFEELDPETKKRITAIAAKKYKVVDAEKLEATLQDEQCSILDKISEIRDKIEERR